MVPRKFVAGNWKMNGVGSSVAMLERLGELIEPSPCDVLVCPPTTLIARMAGGAIAIGGQDCHAEPSGAHTGDVSAEMLADAGASAVLAGHSERRADHGETDAMVAAKVRAAWRAGLVAVVCVGETETERGAGRTLDRLGAQLAASVPDRATGEILVVAYEPVWAIGTGRTPSLQEVGEVHGFMRETLVARFGADVGRSVRLLYGGSVKPANAAGLFAVADVDGALVGGASLDADGFAAIIAAARF